MSYTKSVLTSQIGCLSIVSCLWGAPCAFAAAIYAGPSNVLTADNTRKDGYFHSTAPVNPGSGAGTGVAIGQGQKYINFSNKGERGYRWDATGTFVELENLSQSPASGFAGTHVYSVNASGVS